MKEKKYDVTPVVILQMAKDWLKIYDSATGQRTIARFYCLFFTLELYLKAYLCLKNNKFCTDKKIRELSHNFKEIFKELSKSNIDKCFLKKIEECLTSLNLFNINYASLRFPLVGRMIEINSELYFGNNPFKSIFDCIDKEIGIWDYDEWREVN